MNKLIKGAIACAAGIALLLGGAGTFALWNSTAAAGAGIISSGTLSLAAPAAGSWANITTGTPAAIADINAFRMVPGNILQFTQTLTVNATGDDLTADLTYDPLSITGTPALTSALETTLTATASGAGIVPAGANTFTITPGTSPATVTVVLTVELPDAVTTGQNGTVNLDGLRFTLTQRAI